MAAIKILVIPGSLRTGSLNAKLAAVAIDALVRADVDATRISLGDFPLPIYDGDLESNSGVPKHALDLKRMISAHHGVLIVTPEYNASLPPLVKNTIDWISRVEDTHESKGQVFRERPFAIAAASNGRFIPALGGVMIRDRESDELLGAIGITGDSGENDELVALEAIQECGLKADLS